MITTLNDQLSSTLTDAIAELGGSLTASGSGWNWENGDLQIRIIPKTDAIHFTRSMDEPALNEQALPQIATTLSAWLHTNSTLPFGHRIVLQDNAVPAQQAILPTHVDTELNPSDIGSVLRGFTSTDAPLSDSTSTATRDAIESWATEARVRLATDTDEENSATRYSIKLRGFEPAQLDTAGPITLQIDACPLLQSITSTDTAPASRAACALLSIGATANSHFIRPELTDDSLRYRATFPETKSPLPPASWLAKSVQEIVAALRLSRTELEALSEGPLLATQFLSIRKITPQS